MMESEKILPGPEGIFLSGMDPVVARGALRELAEKAGFGSPPLIFCTKEMLAFPLEKALKEDSQAEVPGPGQLPPVCLFSGLPLESVRPFLQHFNETGLERPIFATATTHNLKFTVKELLLHLFEEHKQQATGSRDGNKGKQ